MKIQKITSRNNEFIKDTVKLSDRKKRTESSKFCFEGKKLFEEAINHSLPIEALIVREDVLDEYADRNFDFPVFSVTADVYEKISFEKSPEGVFCVSKALDKLHILYIIYKGRLFDSPTVILDGIRDPGNLGTILRTAAAFGCQNVIMSEDCADIYNPKTIRASMGAVFHQPTVRVKDLPATISALKQNGLEIYCAALDKNAVSVKNIKIDKNTAFVIGNEGSGIRREVIESAGETAIIPMEAGTESLNAASAATVLLWELYKNS
jgi:TrmH family RNA methyltransferase